MRIQRGAALLALPLSLALAVSACGGGSSGGGKGNPNKPSGNTSGLKAIDINAQPDGNIKQGGTLIWSLDQFSTQWNTNQVNGNEESTANVMNALMPEPTISDQNANLTFDPNYWTSVKMISTSPEKIEYKLNPKAKWSDGTPITVNDFIAEWKALNGTNPKFDAASTSGYDHIGSVTQGTDQFDVIVTFSKPLAEWQGLFNPLYPAAANATPKAFDTMYLNKIPITAGPFKFDHFDKSAQTVTVVPDPNWWGSNKPHLDKIVFKALESTASVQAFVNGEVDVLWDMAVDPSDYKQASQRTDGRVAEAAGPDIRQFTFHGGSGILSDLKLRQAIAMGIDRAAIAKSDLQGLNWPIVTLNNHMLVNTQAGYKDESGSVGKYNPDGAKQLLDSDGWKAGASGIREKNGKQLVVRFTIPAGIASSKNEGELVQAMMQQIGVKLKIVTVPANDFFDKYIIPGNFDITPFSWLGTPFPATGAAQIYQRKQSSNFTGGVGSAQLDALLDKAQTDFDRQQEYNDLNAADALVWQEVHSLTLYQRPQLTGVKNGLANIGAFGFASVDYTKIGYVK